MYIINDLIYPKKKKKKKKKKKRKKKPMLLNIINIIKLYEYNYIIFYS